MVTFLFTLFGQNLSKIIHISRLGNEKSWRNLDIKVLIYFCWVAFEFQFLPHLPCDIFRTNLETSGNMYFDFRKGLWVFIIALYYKSTHLQNSGRDHVQWHKPLGSTLIWLANIIVHCQSCQRPSQDSFVELKFYVYSRCYEYSNSFHPKYKAWIFSTRLVCVYRPREGNRKCNYWPVTRFRLTPLWIHPRLPFPTYRKK